MKIAALTKHFRKLEEKRSGVGFAAYGLTRAQAKRGHEITVIRPRIRDDLILDQKPMCLLEIPHQGRNVRVSVYHDKVEENGAKFDVFSLKIPVHRIVSPLQADNETMVVNRLGLFFDRAAVALLKKIGTPFDVLHAHTGVDFFSYFAKQNQIESPIVYTLHHLEEGEERSLFSDEFALLSNGRRPADLRTDPYVSAIQWSDRIVTVSEGYARELLEGKAGNERYHPVIQGARTKFLGINNGLDGCFNPESIAFEEQIPSFNFENLEGKRECHLELQHSLGLTTRSDIPIVLWSQRLVNTKGIAEFSSVTNQLLKEGNEMQVVIFGSGKQEIESLFQQKEAYNRAKMRYVRFCQFNAPYEALFIMGADIIVSPSLEEPYGQVPRMGMRLGALPIINPVGGLESAVRDGVNGFVIKNNGETTLENSLADELQRALNLFGTEAWIEMQRAAMQESFSWDEPAAQYEAVYQELLQKT
jgi:glycogen synthase